MPTTTTDTAANSIGALLKTTREQRGLTQSDVASQLNLKVVIIEKLEAEQWDTSMATTFVKGYLRAYARLLKLSEREILQAFDLQTAHLRSTSSAMHSFSRKTSREAADSHFMLATYGIVVLLVGLFLIWFWQTHLIDAEPVAVLPDYVAPVETTAASSTALANSTLPSTPESATGNTAQPTGSVATDPTVQQPSAQSAPVARSGTSAQTALTETPLAATQSSAEVPASSIETTEGETPSSRPAAESATTSQAQSVGQQAASANAATGLTPTGAVANSVEQSSASTSPESVDPQVPHQEPVTQTTAPSATTNPAATTGQTAASTQAELQLSFSQDCWLSVLDASQQKVAYGLQKAGTSLKVTGQYPLKLTIGNASAATMLVQGKAYDLSQYKAGQVARITLTGAE